MSKLNKDGFEIGKPITFEQLQAVKAKQREEAKQARSEPKRKLGRPRKQESETEDGREA